MSPLSSSPIGLQFTDTTIRAVHCRGGKVHTHGEQKIPDEIFIHGKIRDIQKAADFLKKFIASLKPVPKTKNVVLCLPPEKVYTYLLTLPNLRKKNLEDRIRMELENVMPEDVPRLTIVSKVLSSSRSVIEVGVAAVRTDVLQRYTDACKNAGLNVAGITTPPCVLASMIHKKKGKSPFVLVDTASDAKGLHTATLFYRDWPIDEAVVSGTKGDQEITNVVEELIREYSENDLPIEHVAVLGSSSMQQGKLPKKPMVLQEALPRVKKLGAPLAAALGASLMKTNSFAFDFFPKTPSIQKIRSTIYILTPVAVLLLVWQSYQVTFTDFANSLFASVNEPPPVERTLPPCNTIEILSSFKDVPSTHGYFMAIEWGAEQGILKGYPDGSFKPEQTVTRAEFLKIVLEAAEDVDLERATKATGFHDVDENEWYASYVRYGKQFNVIEGYPDGTFRPIRKVMMAEALKMAYETLKVETEEVEGEWYKRYLEHAVGNSILFSPEDADPQDLITRRDVAWIVWKLLNPGVEPKVAEPCMPDTVPGTTEVPEGEEEAESQGE